VDVLPSDPAHPGGAIPVNAVADAGDAAQGLGVDVDELARPLALVAPDRRRRLQRRRLRR